MHIGILQADSVVAHLQDAHGDFPAMIEAVLSDAAQVNGVDVTYRTYDVLRGEYPARIDECDGYVITGSRCSVYDDEPWITDLGKYVGELHRATHKTVGLCFGHQLMAHFLGGEAGPADVGWGVGIHTSRVVKQAAFMQPNLAEYNLVVSHKDQVLTLPTGAELLASSDFCPHAMFQLGDHMLALQGHPEFDKPYSKALMDYRREILGDSLHEKGVASLALDTSRREVGRWIIRFINPNGSDIG